ncbi:MAG: hypothetical protein HS116_01505 [Planctomycetes bacterium]|nr:hypothetical protein [Planctomycetota bacterium]
MLLAARAPVLRAADAPALEALEIRILEPDARLILSHGPRLLAALQLRARSADGVAPSGDAWRQTAPLAQGAEVLRTLEWKLPQGRTAAALVSVQRLEKGLHLLVRPGAVEAADGAPPPERAELNLELALELRDEKDAGKLRLFALNSTGSVDVPDPDDDLPEENGRPFPARALSFRDKSMRRVDLARSGPAEWVLRKLDGGRLLTQALRPDPRRVDQPGGFDLFVGIDRDGRAPLLSPLALDKLQTPAGDFLEGAVRVYANGLDPSSFDELTVMAEVAVPAAEGVVPPVLRLPCFYWEAPTDAPAEGEFRFRFAPPKAGEYGVRIVVVAPTGMVRGPAQALRAGPPASRGFVRVRPGERVFRFDDGRVWMPVGLNLAWPERAGDASSMRRRFVELARHGGNATRVWLSHWGLPLEGPRAGRFDPDAAQALDEIFLAAQARDIRIILVAENAHDLTVTSKEHPYFREHGGPLVSAPQFFSDTEAVRSFKRRLSYLAARYGAYRSLWAWELLNEIDEAWPALKADPDDPGVPPVDADRARRFRREAIAWCGTMAQHLEALDVHAHPVTVSTALEPADAWLGLEDAPGLSFVQVHGYVPEAADARDDLAFDEAALLMSWARASREVGRPRRPYLVGEFGYRGIADVDLMRASDEARSAERNLRDRGGILFHNSLMGGLSAGLAGTPMLWWWDRHVERHELWPLLRGPARFAAAIEDLATREDPGTLRTLSNAQEAQAAVSVRGWVGARGLCVWIQDRRSTWAAKLERREADPPAIDDLTVRLPALEPGAYTVTWIDTWDGTVRAPEALEVSAPDPGQAAGPLVLKAPPFARDVAVVVTPK